MLRSTGIRRLWDRTVRDYLEECIARAHNQTVVIAPGEPAKPPAATVLQRFNEAVSGSGWQIRIDRVAATFLLEPDRPKVTLATVGRLYEPARNQTFGCLDRAEAQCSAIGGVKRYGTSELHSDAVWVSQEEKEFNECLVTR